MTNSINTSYVAQLNNADLFGKSLNKTAEKNSDIQFGKAADVEISDAGLNALTKLQSTDTDNQAGDTKLSAKAQSYLENLRKKYGDYDFIISDNMDTAQTVGSTKQYSVILTPEELERMAEDDDYAQKVMGNVGKAVDILKDVSEKDLGEGVQFAQLSVSFDSEGNMKLFAELEKLSDEQKERLELAKQKRAEQQKAAEEKTQSLDENDQPELTNIFFKSADVEADSEEELLYKIFGIDWANIPEEEAYI